MAHIPRHDEIIRIISHLRSVSVQELTQRLKVSEVTIRKDLTLLEEMGNVVRTRGGAQLAEDRAQLRGIQVRKEENLAEKERIAAKARELVNEDDTIYVDSGSTCMLFARRLLDMNLRIVTNSLDIMNVVADAPGISLISVGGSYRKEAGSFIGPMAIEALKGLRIQTCFIGATALSAAGVFSSQNIIEAELKSRVLKSSKRRVVLADAGKFGRDAFAVFARPEDVDILITDRWIEGMRDLTVLGIEVLAAGA
ncbi:MAG: DeoR/GlpR family DNA-binding transcription regulator [Spirochaetia bacterium]